MVATIFKAPITDYLTQILSSLRRHLFHPFWFIQVNPYKICHKLFQPPVEKQFQEFPLALTTPASVCFRNSFFPPRPPILCRWRSTDILNQIIILSANSVDIDCISNWLSQASAAVGHRWEPPKVSHWAPQRKGSKHMLWHRHKIKLIVHNSAETLSKVQSPQTKIPQSFLPDFPFSSRCSLRPLTSAVNGVKILQTTTSFLKRPRFSPELVGTLQAKREKGKEEDIM